MEVHMGPTIVTIPHASAFRSEVIRVGHKNRGKQFMFPLIQVLRQRDVLALWQDDPCLTIH